MPKMNKAKTKTLLLENASHTGEKREREGEDERVRKRVEKGRQLELEK